ncbi:MAG: carboxymethylenebutenolidase, partial [Blastocatellia bacterium]|nr:carboxymethylenebutenolidase [Blastocatellia bacterium]
MVKVKSFDGGEVDAYMALPAGGYGPGIVVLQEIFGVNEFLRNVCDWYAARGFVAICPDLFWRQERGVELTDQTEAGRLKAFELYQGLDQAKAVEDSAAALEFLRQHPACSGRVGAVGFCLGGNLAWLLSARFKPDCAVGYYGVGIEKTLNEADNLSSPLMLHIAGKDKNCPPEAQEQIHEVLAPNPLVTIHDYPENDHAFGRP